jgi:hypothetical protein
MIYHVISDYIEQKNVDAPTGVPVSKSKKVRRDEGRIAMHGLAKANSFRKKKGQCGSRKEAVVIIQV